MNDQFFQVAVNFPLYQSVLTYLAHEDYQVGDIVEVPLGARSSQGVILGQALQYDRPDKLKSILSLREGKLRISQRELELYKWMSKYYHYSLGKLIFDCLPKISKRPKPLVYEQGENLPLGFAANNEQEKIVQSIKERGFDQFHQNLVHGITGSGKSLVYLMLIKEALSCGKSVQFLLPEINLTPQFTQLFRQHLDCKILSYHSALKPSEKYQTWKFLQDNQAPALILSVRSGVFLPTPNLGLVVVDEEHDSSFKQNDRCPYHGRDVAIKKAQLHQCPVILGSATPSLENYYHFKKQAPTRHYYMLKERAQAAKLPQLQLIDARESSYDEDPAWPLHIKTIDVIKKALEASEQVLVFINKLGYAHFLQCRNCGHQFKNEQCGCDNNLRFFKQKNLLSCAHCEFKVAAPSMCPECGSLALYNHGFGTEKVEEVLSSLFKDHRIERFDRDEVTNLKKLNEKLDNFHSGKIDILVGTQMLSKGHNFKKVNTVIILGIDQALNSADFRSTERANQLLLQVSGRSGRYSDRGQVVVQTYNPEHSLFKAFRENPFDGTYAAEIELRELCDCPPFSKMCMIYFSSSYRTFLIDEIQKTSRELTQLAQENKIDVQLLGPAPLSIEKRAKQYTWALMLKSHDQQALHQVIDAFARGYKANYRINVKIDVDAQQTL